MAGSFGQRMKMYEENLDSSIMPGLPVYVRLDGRCFSKFTRDMEYPNPRIIKAMKKVCEKLIEETHATIAYTQSDEISLAFKSTSWCENFLFRGRIQKLASVLAGIASSTFMKEVLKNIPEKAHLTPVFDCRVVQFPSDVELANMFLWRVRDCVKNSIGLTALDYFSHKELQGVSSDERRDMLIQQKGVNWNDLPSTHKEGWWYRREVVKRELTDEERSVIPEKHRPTGPVLRSQIVQMDMPRFDRVINRADVILNGVKPRYRW